MTNTPFEVLGLPASFDLSSSQIEQAFLRRAAGLHPDRFGDSDGAELESAALNHARGILLDAERRANALLDVLVGNAASGPGDRRLPDGFLAEMMEIRERAEAELATGGAEARAAWRGWAEARRAAYIGAVAAMFRQSPPPIHELRATLNAWRYVERMIEQLNPTVLP